MNNHSSPTEPEMSADDRLMDALLREHARVGKGNDDAFLQRLETALDAGKTNTVVELPRQTRTRWAWSLGLAASIMLAALLTWKMLPGTSGGSADDGELVPLRPELPQELAVGTPKDVRTLQAQIESMANHKKTTTSCPAPPASSNMWKPEGPKSEAISRGKSLTTATPARIAGNAPQEESGFDHHPPHDPMPSPAPVDRERYGHLVDNPWRSPADDVFSTFSIDVDTASYANFRRMALSGGRIPADAIRLEEMVNYFDYAYPQPAVGIPFGVQVDSAVTPWNPGTRLIRVALQGREVARTGRAPANLVFLLDVSGSMNEENKLPLVTKSFQLLLEEMNAADTIAIVVYAGAEGLALPPTKCDSVGRDKIDAALKKLQAGGSTNGGAGIQLAYKLAKENFKEGGINRVILATDGDFNVGVTEDGGLVSLVEKNAKSNVFLTVLGFGTGNLNDGMLEAITNKGNGTYHYIDSLNEGRRVFLQKMMGTLLTIAKDVKIQVEFNPAMVAEYRLLGYANRMLNKEDFNNDRVDAGDIGAGHTVTAFYEIKPGPARATVDAPRYPNPLAGAATPAPVPSAAATPANANEWLTVKLRYKEPDGDTSKLIEKPFAGEDKAFSETGEDFRFATAVAMVGSILRETGDFGHANLRQARDMAAAAKGNDPHGLRAEFVGLLDRLLANDDDRPRR